MARTKIFPNWFWTVLFVVLVLVFVFLVGVIVLDRSDNNNIEFIKTISLSVRPSSYALITH